MKLRLPSYNIENFHQIGITGSHSISVEILSELRNRNHCVMPSNSIMPISTLIDSSDSFIFFGVDEAIKHAFNKD